jgi:hypothetical protein
VTAGIAVETQEAVGEYAAGQVGPHLTFDEAGDGSTLAARAGEEGLEVLADDFMEQRLLGLAALVLDGERSAGPRDPGDSRQFPCRRRNGSPGRTHGPEALPNSAPGEGRPAEVSGPSR